MEDNDKTRFVNGNTFHTPHGHGDAMTNGRVTKNHDVNEPHPFKYRLYPSRCDRWIVSYRYYRGIE